MEKIRKFKGLEAPESSQPQDLNKLQMQSGNLYRSLAVIANRSNQISIDLKQELNSKLEEFAVTSEVLEEIVENREQIEISKYYEKLSHPTILALEEFKRDELFYREREESSEESSDASHDEQGEQ